MRFVFVILRVDFLKLLNLVNKMKIKKRKRERKDIERSENEVIYIDGLFRNVCFILWNVRSSTVGYCTCITRTGLRLLEFCFANKRFIYTRSAQYFIFCSLLFVLLALHTWSCRAMQVFEFSVGKLLGTFQFPSIIPGYCLERKFKVRVIRNIDKMSRSSSNRICLQVKTFLYRIFDVDSYRIIETYLRKKKKETSHQFLSSLPFFSIKSFSSAKEKKEEKNIFLFSPLHFVQRIFFETKSRRNNTRPESFIRLLHIRNIVADLCNDPCVTINRRMAGWHDKV